MNKYYENDFSGNYRYGYFECRGRGIRYIPLKCANEDVREIICFTIDLEINKIHKNYKYLDLNNKDTIVEKPYKLKCPDIDSILFQEKKCDTIYLNEGEVKHLEIIWNKWLSLNKKYSSYITPYSNCGENLQFQINENMVLVNMKKYTPPRLNRLFIEKKLNENWYLYEKHEENNN